MALILGIKEGKDFFIRDFRVKIREIHSSTHFDIQVPGPTGLTVVPVVEGEFIEIYPNVRISVGLHGSEEIARVVIDAPSNMKILRGGLYRKEKKNRGSESLPIEKIDEFITGLLRDL